MRNAVISPSLAVHVTFFLFDAALPVNPALPVLMIQEVLFYFRCAYGFPIQSTFQNDSALTASTG